MSQPCQRGGWFAREAVFCAVTRLRTKILAEVRVFIPGSSSMSLSTTRNCFGWHEGDDLESKFSFTSRFACHRRAFSYLINVFTLLPACHRCHCRFVPSFTHSHTHSPSQDSQQKQVVECANTHAATGLLSFCIRERARARAGKEFEQDHSTRTRVKSTESALIARSKANTSRRATVPAAVTRDGMTRRIFLCARTRLHAEYESVLCVDLHLEAMLASERRRRRRRR